MKTLLTIIITVFLTVGSLQAMGWLNNDAEDMVSSYSQTILQHLDGALENSEGKWEKLLEMFKEVSR